MDNIIRIMRAFTTLLAEVVGSSAYVVWYSKEDGAWIAISHKHPGLSGIAPSSVAALETLHEVIDAAKDL